MNQEQHRRQDSSGTRNIESSQLIKAGCDNAHTDAVDQQEQNRPVHWRNAITARDDQRINRRAICGRRRTCRPKIKRAGKPFTPQQMNRGIPLFKPRLCRPLMSIRNRPQRDQHPQKTNHYPDCASPSPLDRSSNGLAVRKVVIETTNIYPPNFFSVFPIAFLPMLDIIPEQTLNRDGMVTSVEFSCGAWLTPSGTRAVRHDHRPH